MTNINTTKVLSTLVNPDKILPVAAIEAFTTAGRVYHGYKRGGEEEGRERLREETTGAVFWLFGQKVLNSFGDFIGEKCGIKNINVDVGRDELRAPYLNIPENTRFKTCAFKFSKIITSALIATALTGFVVPKINHWLTNKYRLANGLEPIPEKRKKNSGSAINREKQADSANSSIHPLCMPTLAQFIGQAKISAQKISNSPTFKGANNLAVNMMSIASHNLENNTAWRLISTDAGTIAGRVVNSRNKFEAFEYLFRDTSSIYFYLFAAPQVAGVLNHLFNNTLIHPDSLEVVKEHYINSIGENKFSPEAFLRQVKTVPDNLDELVSSIPFDKKGIITLDDFNKSTFGKYKNKALVMSQLQPKMHGVSLLSKQQVLDILSDGWNTEPEFLKNSINAGTYGKALNPDKFVSRKTVESIRFSIDNFSDNLVKYAKCKNIKTIDADFIKKYAKQTLNNNFAFRLAGMGIAAFGLAWLIPKLQNKITEIRTGSSQFPGTADYSEKRTAKKDVPLNLVT